jgi:hypothetical protein
VNNFSHRPFRPHRPAGPVTRVTDVYHRITSRHQVEIEVQPPRAQVHFADGSTANPADTQTRFEAIVYNSDQGYFWEVRDLAGNPGMGTIDASGLYRAPAKGLLANGTTEIIVATSREDRMRRAYAWVTLVGDGPARATVEIRPKHATLYYGQGFNNNFMDDSNKMRQFDATVRNGAGGIEWLVNNAPPSATGPWFLYQTPNNGGTATVTIRARLQADHSIFDEAKVQLLNYSWPGL